MFRHDQYTSCLRMFVVHKQVTRIDPQHMALQFYVHKDRITAE